MLDHFRSSCPSTFFFFLQVHVTKIIRNNQRTDFYCVCVCVYIVRVDIVLDTVVLKCNRVVNFGQFS